MLTKDLLQFSHRSGKIFPNFIDESNPRLISAAKELVDVFSKSPGRTSQEIESIGESVESRERCIGGLRKILTDRCKFQDLDDSIVEARWEILQTAQDMRDDSTWTELQDFERILSERCGSTISQLRSALFADHPDERKCIEFDTVSPEDLLADYNRALMQTLFIFSDDVTISIKNASLPEKRSFFRQLKFHSLMSEVAVDPEDSLVTVYLSGPLKLFQKSTTYGLRLARFILTVLHFSKWEVEATVQLKNKRLILKLDDSCGLKPKGRGLIGYVPEDFAISLESFNAASDQWKMQVSDDFVNIGKQNYCFPDFDLVSGRNKIHVELFHPWHKGQIIGRLEALKSSKIKNLIIGVEKSLCKDKQLKSTLEASPWFLKYGFEFSQFPTPKQLLKMVVD